jgi:hypothetical protein
MKAAYLLVAQAEVKREVDECETKNKLLRSIVGHAIDLTAIKQRWDVRVVGGMDFVPSLS